MAAEEDVIPEKITPRRSVNKEEKKSPVSDPIKSIRSVEENWGYELRTPGPKVWKTSLTYGGKNSFTPVTPDTPTLRLDHITKLMGEKSLLEEDYREAYNEL